MYKLGPITQKKVESYYNLNRSYIIDHCWVYNADDIYVGHLERSNPKDTWLLYDVTYHCQGSFGTIEDARDVLGETDQDLKEFWIYLKERKKEMIERPSDKSLGFYEGANTKIGY